MHPGTTFWMKACMHGISVYKCSMLCFPHALKAFKTAKESKRKFFFVELFHKPLGNISRMLNWQWNETDIKQIFFS